MGTRIQGNAQQILQLWLNSTYGHRTQVRHEHRFHPTRKWRFDSAMPRLGLAFEMDGILGGQGGAHQRRQGYLRDREKDLEAAALGWQVIRLTPQQLQDGSALPLLGQIIERAIAGGSPAG